ncbi:N-acyl amino acid synthase FeeM domain-containing protein [Sorangium atrum]|uniref:GNAT family N-acetyltransferase n=1 Tax=Sorangium atrum TaxID=2995308 RepID=A0ABT5BVW0_9BACT|nr:GNAT family N-acyltransferase [Sorangium aterium]MDC0678285.1 GNAT family N-acetyltransferase [Sorangium aterium]
MKKRIRVSVADTPTRIAEAQRVRNQVFVREKGLLNYEAATIDWEMDIYDDLETTLHFIAYVDDAPVATARLIGHNLDVARAIGQPLGIDLASRYDLGPFVAAGVSLAEVSRMCIVPQHRGTAVLCELYLAMYRESLRVGLTHWVGAGNAETDALEDAEVAYRIAERRGLVSPRWRIAPRPGANADGPSTRPLYTPAERARARAGDLQGLKFPRTLETFAHLAARYMGGPIRERGYTVCSLPLVVELADVVHTRAFLRSLGCP